MSGKTKRVKRGKWNMQNPFWIRDIQSGEDMVTKSRQLIHNAEADLGELTDGQRRDLLKDNLLISREEARLIVDFLRD